MKIKYVGKDRLGIKGQSFVGHVQENDIIDVSNVDYARLILKAEHGKPLFEAVKEKPKSEKKAEVSAE